jgi:hypothetical protein
VTGWILAQVGFCRSCGESPGKSHGGQGQLKQKGQGGGWRGYQESRFAARTVFAIGVVEQFLT